MSRDAPYTARLAREGRRGECHYREGKHAPRRYTDACPLEPPTRPRARELRGRTRTSGSGTAVREETKGDVNPTSTCQSRRRRRWIEDATEDESRTEAFTPRVERGSRRVKAAGRGGSDESPGSGDPGTKTGSGKLKSVIAMKSSSRGQSLAVATAAAAAARVRHAHRWESEAQAASSATADALRVKSWHARKPWFASAGGRTGSTGY